MHTYIYMYTFKEIYVNPSTSRSISLFYSRLNQYPSACVYPGGKSQYIEQTLTNQTNMKLFPLSMHLHVCLCRCKVVTLQFPVETAWGFNSMKGCFSVLRNLIKLLVPPPKKIEKHKPHYFSRVVFLIFSIWGFP